MSTTVRITAADAGSSLTVTLGGSITASATTRTLGGELVRWGVYGRTSRGRLKVRPGALRFPDDLGRVKLTREHERDNTRGYLAAVEPTPATDKAPHGGLRVSVKASATPEGDAAISEAADRQRDAFSFDVVDAVIEGDEIVSAQVIAIGQVGIPAYDDARIDTIAASQPTSSTTSTTPPERTIRMKLTPQQRARLAELRAKGADKLTADEVTELDTLTTAALDEATTEPEAPAADAPAAAPTTQQVAASMPSVPAGVPAQRQAARTSAADPLTDFIRTVCEGYRGTNPNPGAITAALADVTYSAHNGNINAPGWSGELWSGLAYEPEFTPLLNSGTLDGIKGSGWRWVVKPEMQDYAGDKAAIPSNTPDTEAAEYTAARMAVGHDLDRAFYDFPNEAFLRGYVEACRESWAMKLDLKAEAFITTNAVAATIGGIAVPAQASLLKAVGKAARSLKRNKVGKATFVVTSDNDFDTLMDIADKDVPAFLELFGIDPSKFTSSGNVADGTVIAGVKQAATVRTLPGSPIRASAQHIANGGIDEAFFGYWAIEEHHTSGIVKVTWA
jgi:hypothetical protein